MLRRLGCRAAGHHGRGDRHRRQDLAPLGREIHRPGGDPQGLGLRGAPEAGPGPAQGEPEIQRNHRHKADYVLALKGNQGTLREDVDGFVTEQAAKGFPDTATSRAETIDADHGRIETRTTTVVHDVGGLQERHGWPALRRIVIADSRRELPAPTRRTERETRSCITSLTLPADRLGPIIRSHWAIENSLHWVRDMTFRDDECRVRTEHAPADFTTIRHIAHNLVRKAPGKDSFRMRREIAAWDGAFLASLSAA